MARNNFAQTTSVPVALVAATIKTVLELTAPANTIVAVTGVDVTFDGVSNSAIPVIVQLQRVATTGTGTGRNPLKTKDTSTALATTGKENDTVEPGTPGNIMRIFHVHPQAGVIYQLPIRDEVEVPGAGLIALRITAPAGVNCLATIHGEE